MSEPSSRCQQARHQPVQRQHPNQGAGRGSRHPVVREAASRRAADGRSFITEVVVGIEHLDLAVKTAGAISTGTVGRLYIGLHSSIAAGFLADLRRKYREIYPDIELVIAEGRSADTIRQVREGALDIAFVLGAVDAPDCHSRLYDAIESGVADLSDPALKDRTTGLEALRGQAQVDAERAQAMLESSGNRAVTPVTVRCFADVARQRIRLDGGGYRRDHLRAFAQRVEVGEAEVRIMGSKGELLRTLIAVSSGKSAAIGVPSLGLKWRKGGPPNS